MFCCIFTIFLYVFLKIVIGEREKERENGVERENKGEKELGLYFEIQFQPNY